MLNLSKKEFLTRSNLLSYVQLELTLIRRSNINSKKNRTSNDPIAFNTRNKLLAKNI